MWQSAQVHKLAPAPKLGQASAQLDNNMYRGVSVASIFSKVIDKLLHWMGSEG
jgi:hypothetical protein